MTATTSYHSAAFDLSDLMGSLSLDSRWVNECEKGASTDYTRDTHQDPQESMSMVSDDISYQSDNSESTTSSSYDDSCGCALLSTFLEQLDRYPTTGGEYLEVIFMHRELFAAFPAAHRSCSRAWADLSERIQHREWRSDREGDQEAAAAFCYEATRC